MAMIKETLSAAGVSQTHSIVRSQGASGNNWLKLVRLNLYIRIALHAEFGRFVLIEASNFGQPNINWRVSSTNALAWFRAIGKCGPDERRSLKRYCAIKHEPIHKLHHAWCLEDYIVQGSERQKGAVEYCSGTPTSYRRSYWIACAGAFCIVTRNGCSHCWSPSCPGDKIWLQASNAGQIREGVIQYR